MGEWRRDPVPEDWRGLWRRVALQRADGSGDLTTTVLWLQTNSLFADIRIPAGRRQAEGPTGFEDLTADLAAALGRQEGFAGALLWSDDRCHWERRIDFAPLDGPPDEGRLHRERRMMVEHGLHAAYVEHWWQDIEGHLPVLAGTEHMEPFPRVVVRAGDRFLFAEDRRPVRPAPGSLECMVAEAAGDTDRLRALLDCEISYGRIRADGWRIGLSTLPWREGARLSADERMPG